MSIRMVRQPSETPNINNIDDIIPFRYAYGNQNGYVIGKGNELSYTINGSEFKINSGRIVLQGVESDIDANGVAFTVDTSSSTKQYYVIYYRVNLATNGVSIEATYDIAGYPTIETGDDLTINSSGYANLELYRFEVENGVISNVVKIVQEIKYAEARTINGLNIKPDGNGMANIDGAIILQKKLLWSGENSKTLSNSAHYISYDLSFSNINFEVGKTYEIHGYMGIQNGETLYKNRFILRNVHIFEKSGYSETYFNWPSNIDFIGGKFIHNSETQWGYYPCSIEINPSTDTYPNRLFIRTDAGFVYQMSSDSPCFESGSIYGIEKIYEIID